MLKVAVLGANGFIGSRTVEMIHLQGRAEVRPVVRRAAAQARAARFALDGRIADATDEAALRRAFTGCAVVVHAVAGDPAMILAGVEPVYRAAQAAGVRRLVYLSSAAVHGQSPAPGTHEESPLSDRQPLPYNTARIRAEAALSQLRRGGEVEVVLLRPGIVYGPRSRWTAGVADELLAGRAVLVGRGDGICNGIYVDNLVHAIHLASTSPAAGVDGEAFLLSDRERITWFELYEPIARALGLELEQLPRAIYQESRADWRQRLYAARTSRAGRVLRGATPPRLRRAAASALRAWRDFPQNDNAEAGSSPTGRPQATLEMELLQRCRYKLPFDKASAALGYEPPVTFAEACRRSIGWLAFAGYPVVSATDAGRTAHGPVFTPRV